jgi:hypothetical protein
MAGIRLSLVLDGKISSKQYNNATRDNLDDFLDFISVSYALSHRCDSDFWMDRKKQAFITERMKVWLKLAKRKIQPPEKHILFVDSSWISKLIGFNYLPNDVLWQHKNDDAIKEIAEIRTFKYNDLISQKEYLDRFIYGK